MKPIHSIKRTCPGLPGHASYLKRWAVKEARLLKDLFSASQSQEVAATRLLITHFHYAIKYPETHVLGILDGIAELMKGSFLGLKVLGFHFTMGLWDVHD